MRNIQKGIDLIKKWEGFRAKAYRDPVGIWTIGYGTIRYPNGERVRAGEVVNVAQAEAYLTDHVRESVLPYMEDLITVPVTDNQYGALVSFIYNLGAGNFRKSTLLKKINNEDWFGAADEFDKWVYAGGRKLKGLVRRRAEEKALFKTPSDNVVNEKDPISHLKFSCWDKFMNWLNKFLPWSK